MTQHLTHFIGCGAHYEPHRNFTTAKPGNALCINCSSQKSTPGSVLCPTCQPGTIATPEIYKRPHQARPTDPRAARRDRRWDRGSHDYHYTGTEDRPVTLPHVSILDADLSPEAMAKGELSP